MSVSSFVDYTLEDANLHTKPVAHVDWSSDGGFLSSFSYDRSIKIARMDPTGSIIHIDRNIPSPTIVEILWHPSQRTTFAAMSAEKNVDIWDLRGTKPMRKLLTMGNNLNGCWSSCGRYIAVGNRSDLLIVFDVRMTRYVRRMKFPHQLNGLAWSANSDYLLAATGKPDLGSVDLVEFQYTYTSSSSSSSLSSSSSSTAVLAAENNDSNINNHNSSNRSSQLNIVKSFPAHTANCDKLKIDPYFRRVVVSGEDNQLSLWDLEDMICHHTLNFDAGIMDASFSSDGSFIAVATGAGKIHFCNSDTGEIVGALNHQAKSLSWHPRHAHILAVASSDRWSTAGGKSGLGSAQILSFQQ